MKNNLNELSGKEWIKFQKSWFVHDAKAGKRGKKILHPATFPESLCAEFISFFTKPEQIVFDPMCGSGSTLVASTQLGRQSIGVELSPEYAALAAERLSEARSKSTMSEEMVSVVHNQDIRRYLETANTTVNYVLTSPPYWDMLRRKGDYNQQKRRDAGLNTHYSELDEDLGNITGYGEFLASLVEIYVGVKKIMAPKAYMTIIVKNVKKGGKMYPLAWDLARFLSAHFTLKDEKIWCQDNQMLAPYGMYNAWVSNTHHHYCLQFRKEE